MAEKKLSFAQNALWNTAGSLVYNLCLWGVTLAVVRQTADFTAPGTLQLAMAVTNVFAVFSSWELKTCLVSDVEGRFSVGEYLGAQLLAGALALGLCGLYAAAFGYGLRLGGSILVYMLYRALSSRCEVFCAVSQKHSRMDYVGISFLLRGLGMLLAFSLAHRLTGSVTAAMGAMGTATAAVLWLYDRGRAQRFETVRPVLAWGALRRLLWESAPAVLSAALFSAVVTLPRQALEAAPGGREALGIYATAAAPVLLLQVLSTSIFDPAVRSASEHWAAGRTEALRRLGGRLLLLLAAITAAAALGTRFLGRWALVLLYGERIGPYSGLLGPVVLCAALYSACWLMSRGLILLRRMTPQLLFSLASLALSAALSAPLIRAAGMNGVSYAVIAGYGLFFLLSLWYILRQLRCRERSENA